MSRSITEGIIDAFAHGLLTSTSILTNAPGFADAIERWKWLESEREAGRLQGDLRQQCGDTAAIPFDLGVHLNLTQGQPLTTGYPAELLNREGCFPGIGTLFRKLLFRGERWRTSIRYELIAQVSRLADLGIRPTHLNGHQYISLVPVVSAMVPELAQHFQIRVVRVAYEKNPWNAMIGTGSRIAETAVAWIKRHYAARFRRQIQNAGLAHPAQFFGTCHAGHIRLPLLQRFLESATPNQSCEIGMHPGRQSNPAIDKPPSVEWEDPLSELRPLELQLLLDPAAVQVITNSGRELSRLRRLG